MNLTTTTKASDGSLSTVEAQPVAPDNILNRIHSALDEIRPALQFDGGDAEIIGWSDETGVVQLHLQGACSGCGMSEITLQQGIERIIRERVPEVRAVVAV